MTFARRGAESLCIALTTHPINSAADLDAALLAASAGGADSLFIISSRLTGVVAAKIGQHGQERRLPVIASWREFAASGALLSYGPSPDFRGSPPPGSRLGCTRILGLLILKRRSFGNFLALRALVLT